MRHFHVALYARVSSDQQAKDHTIDSQVEAILERAAADRCSIPEANRFIDEGCSGASLLRPALERLRDLVGSGGVDRVYVHSPDRLARSFVHQIVLTEEFERSNVEILFLNRTIGSTPEDAMMLHMQGAWAEYERSKLLERTRRGRRYAARRGLVSALGAVPYGYRYISKQQGDGVAQVEILPEQAETVRQIFEWVACDRLPLWQIRQRLAEGGIPSPQGQPMWSAGTLLYLLKNPAYIGQAAYGKWRSVPWRRPRRPHRGMPEIPRTPDRRVPVPEEEWVHIAVPALVDRAWFEAVGEQLQRNREQVRIRREGATYLLQGLMECRRCHYAYTGHKAQTKKRGDGSRAVYRYYICNGTQRAQREKVPGQVRCGNRQIPAEFLENAVWAKVKELLNEPERVEEEYLRRLRDIESKARLDLAPVRREEAHLRGSLSRLIDGYTEGLLEKTEFESRSRALRHRLVHLEAQERDVQAAEKSQEEIRYLVGQLATFAEKVREGLDTAEWQTRRDLIQTLVKRIEIDLEEITIVFRVGESRPPEPSSDDFLRHCPRLHGRG